ncbi:MAG: type IX secretion system membrane protein PorP/SprF [Bacteroidetes bacterium]|nr:type IX secretion system membrane protein PorP/SprF [Bacteroidota bacterium]
MILGKKFVINGLCMLIAGCAYAQQQPYYTQYILNNFILNPALAGIENYWDCKASYRNQWVGLDGAPTTLYFTVHVPLGKSDYDKRTPTTVPDLEAKSLGAKQFSMEYTAPPAHHGVGFSIINDKTGPLSRIAAYASYAYHVPVGPKTTLSFGLSGGVQEVTVDVASVNFGQTNPVDPAVLQSGYLNKLEPDLNAGLWLSNTNFFLGLSAQQIIPVPINANNGTTASDSVTLLKGKLIPHTFLTAGYKIIASDDITVLPSVMFRYVQPLPVDFDINAKVQYQDVFWVGLSYRYKTGFAAMMGVNISSTFNLGYSYDYTTTLLNTVSHGTHEIVLGFLWRKKSSSN